MMTEDAVSLAWLAGIIDGEGSIYISKRNRLSDPVRHYKNVEYELFLEVGNLSKAMILKAQDIIGGKGSLQEKNYGGKPYYRLCLCSRDAETVLKAIQQYLVAKQKRAKLALEFQGLKTRFMKNGRFTEPPKDILDRREEIYVELSRINANGAESK